MLRCILIVRAGSLSCILWPGRGIGHSEIRNNGDSKCKGNLGDRSPEPVLLPVSHLVKTRRVVHRAQGNAKLL